jgi:cell division protein FtsW
MIQSIGHRTDRLLVYCLGVLIIFGLVVLSSASSPLGYTRFQDAYFFVKKQVFYGLIPGLLLAFIVSRVNYQWWRKVAWLVYGGALFLLSLVSIKGIGVVINGSRSWFRIGGASFQPSEIAKIAIILFLAYILTSKKFDWSDWKSSFLPIMIFLAPIFILVLLQDVGTFSIIGCIFFVMLYVSRIPSSYLMMVGLGGITIFVVLVLLAPYRVNRLNTFLHPEIDPLGKGYQVNQAFLAVGSGGFFGLGLGNSRQKFQYLPEVNADSVFAVLAEEMGFLFAAGTIVLILIIGWRGIIISSTASDEYGALVSVGITTWFVYQSFLNIGAMVGALPLTGVPLPFISHGGSAYIAMLTSFGILANVSKNS